MVTVALLTALIMGNCIPSSGFLWTPEPTCFYQEKGQGV